LIADGAMGTNLFARGLEAGHAPELWNEEHPDRVRSVHQEMVDAGCDSILTNSFGANSYRLKLHDREHDAFALSRLSATLARQVADAAGRPVLVAGSIGPTGELFQPVGPLTLADGTAAFADQARGLAAGGADLLWLETMSSTEEVEAALAGARATGLPVVSTMTFDTAGHTMMGVAPETAVAFYGTLDHPPAAMGANCGLGPTENLLSITGMARGAATLAAAGKVAPVLVAKANCGVPVFHHGHFHYTGTPELMAAYARLARDAGARIIGGCCGSDGTIMKAIIESLRDYAPGSPPERDAIIAALGPNTTHTDDIASEHDEVLAQARARRSERRRRQAG
ncbi:MAG: betaine--homocysteine S-methyltransferase, partial [Alphaproteobacteria bacterium]